MRTLVTFGLLSLFAPSVLAAPSDGPPPAAAPAPIAARVVEPTPIATPAVDLVPIDLLTVPERCQSIAKNATLPSLPQALSARISLASCLADVKLKTLDLIDGYESIVAIDDAIAPSVELLDQVTAVGGPAAQVIAQHAKADLYATMAMRMLATVPPATGTSPEAQALRDSRRAVIENMILPWGGQALAAHAVVVEIAKAHPELANNPVVRTAVRDSQQHLLASPAVATRE